MLNSFANSRSMQDWSHNSRIRSLTTGLQPFQKLVTEPGKMAFVCLFFELVFKHSSLLPEILKTFTLGKSFSQTQK